MSSLMAECMRVYDPLNSDDSELCHPIRNQGFDEVREWIQGVPRSNDWQPITVELIREDEGEVLCRSDSPWLGSYALVFRSSAVDAMESILLKHGELLPLDCPGEELYIYNPLLVLDALDESASTITRFRDGRIMGIDRHVFRPDVIRGVDVFKLSCKTVSLTYVSQDFVDLWQASGLWGLEFPLLWSEE